MIKTPSAQLELSTYQALEIDKMYQRKINELLRNECDELLSRVSRRKAKGRPFADIWEEQLDDYTNYVLNKNCDILNKYLYKAILSSTILPQWIDSNS